MGSHDTTACPRAVASALKLAGPSAHPRMDDSRSASVSANIRRYSSNDRPHGTTRSSVNTPRLYVRDFRLAPTFDSLRLDLAGAVLEQLPAGRAELLLPRRIHTRELLAEGRRVGRVELEAAPRERRAQ